MDPVSLPALIAFIAIGGAVALAALFALGSRLEREMEEHTLHVQAARLRRDYSRWVAALRRGEGDTVERPTGARIVTDRRDAA